MQNIQIYMLPGLGFDERIFSNLTLNCNNINYLRWLEPNNKETLSSYVKRISKQISIKEKDLILIGHSFGGIVVQEISKLLKVKKIILLSSIKSEYELPLKIQLMKYIPFYNLISKEVILNSFPLWARLFGYNSEKGRRLFVEMLSNSSNNYLRWSLQKISAWKQTNKKLPEIIQIHGTRDKTFPIKLIKKPIVIEDGSHFMVYSKADEISEIINKVILD